MKRNWILLDPSPAEGGAPAPTPAPAPAPAAGAAPPDASLKAAIEKARLEERTKLQEQLRSLTSDKEALASKLSELEGQLKALGSVKTANGQVDVAALIAQVTESAQAATQTVTATLQRELEEMKAQNHRLHLERVRQKAIADNGGEKAMVVALVTGNSEPEILASVEEAKRTHAQIVEQAKSLHGHAPGAPASSLPPSPPAPAAPAPATPALSGMTVQQWGQQRSNQLAALKEKYS